MELTRITGEACIDWMWYANEEIFRADRGSLKSTGADTYEACLSDAVAGLPRDLNLLALFGGLYREACLSFNPENAETLGLLFRLSLEQFCSEPWLASHGAYLEDLAKNRILYGKSEYLPPDSNSSAGSEFELSEIKSRGLVVALRNPKLKYFMENKTEVSLVFKCWMISLMPAEEIDKADWNEPLSDVERYLIKRIKSGISRIEDHEIG